MHNPFYSGSDITKQFYVWTLQAGWHEVILLVESYEPLGLRVSPQKSASYFGPLTCEGKSYDTWFCIWYADS